MLSQEFALKVTNRGSRCQNMDLRVNQSGCAYILTVQSGIHENTCQVVLGNPSLAPIWSRRAGVQTEEWSWFMSLDKLCCAFVLSHHQPPKKTFARKCARSPRTHASCQSPSSPVINLKCLSGNILPLMNSCQTQSGSCFTLPQIACWQQVSARVSCRARMRMQRSEFCQIFSKSNWTV